MTWAAFLLGFLSHATLVMCTRNRRHADVVAAWQYRAIGAGLRSIKGGYR